jgi:hypothetical protein
VGVHESGGQLGKAMKELLLHWEETKVVWNDPVGRDFEQRHLIPLQMDLKIATAAMGQMAQLLDRIRQDCT